MVCKHPQSVGHNCSAFHTNSYRISNECSYPIMNYETSCVFYTFANIESLIDFIICTTLKCAEPCEVFRQK